MNPKTVKALLEAVAKGKTNVADALAKLPHDFGRERLRVHAALAHAGQIPLVGVQPLAARGDLHAASAHEHANPYTGHPSVYQGVDEHFAAWLVDLIVRHAVGIHPSASGIRLDPLPLGLDSLALAGLKLRGRTVGVAIGQNGVRATIDGTGHSTSIGTPLDLAF